MKVLLVSPFVDPDSVGEPRWCYDLARAIVARVPAVIVAQTPRNRSYRIADLFPGVEVHEHAPWQMDYVPRRIHALFKPNYARFYWAAKLAIAKRIDRAAITCAHQFGPLGLRFPSPLGTLGIPYVVGPLGGSLPTPPALSGERGKQPWYYVFRDVDGFRFRKDPVLRASFANAACVVGVAPYVREVLAPIPLRGFETWPEIAAKPPVADIETALAHRASRGGPVRFLVVSRLVFSKGVQFALRAAARLSAGADWRIDVLGDGPARDELAALVGELGLGDRVTLHGHVPRARVDDFYRDADVFLFPSIREPSGAVVFEAMAWGLPMIAADYGGPAAHVREEFGFRVPITSANGYVDGIAAAMAELVATPGQRADMGRAALHSARTRNSMDAMADYFIDLYARVGRPADAAAGLKPADRVSR